MPKGNSNRDVKAVTSTNIINHTNLTLKEEKFSRQITDRKTNTSKSKAINNSFL